MQSIEDRRALVAVLTRRGMSARAIAKMIGISQMTVERDRVVVMPGHEGTVTGRDGKTYPLRVPTEQRPSRARNDGPFFVYCFYGHTPKRLLYVGSTNDPAHRFARHAAEQFWWSEVTERDTSEVHDTEHQARAAEARAITRERPLYNKVRFKGRER